MKKVLALIAAVFVFLGIGCRAFADDSQAALQFFNNYVQAANNYSASITEMYSPNAKIIRQVVKPNGELVNVYTNTSTYMKQLQIGQATAKLRHYKNTYKDISVVKVNNGYKINSLRQPSGESYWLKAYMIVKKQPNGKWLIVEELMQTKEQIFLKYAK